MKFLLGFRYLVNNIFNLTGGDSTGSTDNVHGNNPSASQEQFVEYSHTMGIQMERVAPNYANIVSLGPNQVISDDFEYEQISQVGNSVSIVHVEETVEPIVKDDGNSRPYENVVSSHPYANLDLSQCHTAAGVVNETYAEKPLNSKKKSLKVVLIKGVVSIQTRTFQASHGTSKPT